MKFLVIGDEVTVLAYSLVGVRGIVVQNAEEAREALRTAINDQNIGVILITQRIAAEIQSDVDSAKIERTLPVVLEIPDRFGPEEGLGKRESASDVVRKLIGIKV